MNEVIRVRGEHYILATSSLADGRTRVLKHADTFGIFDRYGDVQPIGMGEQGLFHEGTRFLSRFSLNLDKVRPLLLNSTVREDNTLFTADLTNPDDYIGGDEIAEKDTLHISRTKFLWQATCYERLILRNYGSTPIDVTLSIEFDADFSDIFEVRGTKRKRRGKRLDPVVEEASVVIPYEGLDGVTRRTILNFSPRPKKLTGKTAIFKVSIAEKERLTFFVTISSQIGKAIPERLSYDDALKESEKRLNSAQSRYAQIFTSNEQFNDWVNRSASDLQMMVTDTPHGMYPYAGVPWFNTPFGRDGIITALECLWINPEIARGVLAYLAATQAKEVNPAQDAEPGKILHETRGGEMAALGEIPFGSYYGSVDATALFVLLAGAYYERTADRAFIESIWPNVESALNWVDNYGDLDHDGFVEYARRTPSGLVNQGWKDSHDSVFHADGTIPEGPIALCEVQAYVYAAKRNAAKIASVLGKTERAAQLFREAKTLQDQFEEAFWIEEISTFALALDGSKRPCKVRTSNAGHALFAGIASEEHARRTAATLMAKDSFSGWGIQTLSSLESMFNPMSYHNGSIWPHDNALIAYGLANYGFKDFAVQILTGQFDASLYMDIHRMPELFCGFTRIPKQGPILYPVANAPQSWAAASVFLLLQACLGLSINAPESQIRFSYPMLPESLSEIKISNLKVGNASVDLRVSRHANDVGVIVERREGDIEVIVIK